MDKEHEVGLPSNQALTYTKYLRVNELISLQTPVAEPKAHDEMLFIIIHQTYELWFKQINYELTALIQHLTKDDLLFSFRMMDRISEIFRVLVQQIEILETMTPIEFNRFRSNLNPASGFQSLQFRELELLAGAQISEYERFTKLEPEWMQTLQRRKTQPSLRETFFALLERHGVVTADSSHETIVKAISAVYLESRHDAIQNLCEHLIRFDEQISLWRFRHVQMVERMIGMKRGTGGSLGVNYLQSTLKKRFFPELWEARTEMGADY